MIKRFLIGIMLSMMLCSTSYAWSYTESLGTFTLTFYCPCKKCSGKWGRKTASGAICEEGRTVAVDPKVIPLGSHIIINGHEYIAEDTGVYGNRIDIFMESHSECLRNGVQKAEVFVVK